MSMVAEVLNQKSYGTCKPLDGPNPGRPASYVSERPQDCNRMTFKNSSCNAMLICWLFALYVAEPCRGLA